jgi:hypothetical protein
MAIKKEMDEKVHTMGDSDGVDGVVRKKERRERRTRSG